MFGLTTTRRLRAELAAAHAESTRLRKERDQLIKDRDAFQAAAATAARQFTETDEKYVDVCLVNACLTDDLTEARARIAEYGIRRTVPEVLEEHDIHRKAIAEAIKAGLHLNWQQLIDTVRQTYEGATEWRADFEAEKKRADQLQQRLDEACGLNDGRVEDGRHWQHTRSDKPHARKEGAA